MRSRRSLGVVVLGVVALVATACSSTPRGDFEVVLSDYAIEIPPVLTLNDAGEVWMEISVDGHAHHNFSICPTEDGLSCSGDPVTQRFERKPTQARDINAVPDATRAVVLGNGWDATLSAELDPGSYRVFCGIVGHAAKGMQGVVEVRAAGN